MCASFFEGCTDFKISGGTFNEVRGNLNNRTIHHTRAQQNTANVRSRFDSRPVYSSNDALSPSTSSPPRSGAAGDCAGARIDPYEPSRRGSDPLPQIADRRSRTEGFAPRFPFEEPEFEPISSSGQGITSNAQSTPYRVHQTSEPLPSNSLNNRRPPVDENPWDANRRPPAVESRWLGSGRTSSLPTSSSTEWRGPSGSSSARYDLRAGDIIFYGDEDSEDDSDDDDVVGFPARLRPQVPVTPQAR
ncbi:hypothetical protein R3P38DRAFT_2860021 [Favolaschia claudopus]|uniref:Uncharacterized protein n=1 Tax=Favolaschia claudopus TaxID=2862362 RepID=A0AAW0DMY9_9AGAR